MSNKIKQGKIFAIFGANILKLHFFKKHKPYLLTKKHIMKKFLLSIFCLFGLIGIATAEEAVFNFTAPTTLTPSITDDLFKTTTTEGAYEFATSETTFTQNGVELNTTNGSTASRIWKAASGKYDLRMYKTATMTITAPEGAVITSIAFEGGTVSSFSSM